MSKDYANKTKKTKGGASRRNANEKRKPVVRTNNQPQSVERWIIVGIVLGIFVGGLYFMKEHQKEFQKNKIATVVHKKVPPEAKKSEQPEFDFYTILPKAKVWEPTDATTSTATQTTTPNQATSATTYVVQVGAFEKYTLADQLKAKLILEGYTAQVDKKPINNLYRVWIGPLKTLSAAQATQAKIAQSNKIYGIIHQVAVN